MNYSLLLPFYGGGPFRCARMTIALWFNSKMIAFIELLTSVDFFEAFAISLEYLIMVGGISEFSKFTTLRGRSLPRAVHLAFV